MARRLRTSDELDPRDLLASMAGAILGLATGYVLAGSIGRVNAHRVKNAVRRWRDRPRRTIWTADEAERLEARVLDALARDVVLARRPIRVTVLGQGLVELTGRVSSSVEIGLAGDIVQDADGVTTVLNHILVEGADAGVGVPGPRTPRAARS
jgi:osmotically-inducible protein OsmY